MWSFCNVHINIVKRSLLKTFRGDIFPHFRIFQIKDINVLKNRIQKFLLIQKTKFWSVCLWLSLVTIHMKQVVIIWTHRYWKHLLNSYFYEFIYESVSWVRQRCRVSCVTGASNWYWFTVGQGLPSLQQVSVEGECFYFFCFFTYIHFPPSPLSLSFISSTISSPFLWKTTQGWLVVKPQRNQSKVPLKAV